MRAMQHQKIMRPAMRTLSAAGAILIGLTFTGCSAVNMTGFSMPVFGLTKKASSESDGLTTAAIPSEEDAAGEKPTSLIKR